MTKKRQSLTSYERETIITFKEAETTARIFTYSKKWQRHLENKMELKPTLDNGFGGKGYELPKQRIPMPRAPRKLSPQTRQQLVERGKRLRRVSQPTLL